MKLLAKRYQYKIYSKDGIFIKEWGDIIDDPMFSSYINGGLGEMTIKLARGVSDFGENEDVKIMNELRVFCYDKDNTDGVLIYTGYLSNYEPVVDGSKEYINCHFLGYQTELKNIIYENADGETEITHNSKDPSIIMRDILDKASIQGSKITYTTDSLPPTGNIVSYTFNTQNCLEAVEKCLELSPEEWYWYVDTDKNLYMKARRPFALHTFTIGKEIIYIAPEKRVENVINVIYFTGGGEPPLYRKYLRQNSIGSYGIRAIRKIDSRITLTSTMDTIASRILDANENPEIRIRLRVVDNNFDMNGYDIESVKVGDTCQIRNYLLPKYSSRWDVMKWNQDYWGYSIINLTETVMSIMAINYRPDYIELEISSKLPFLSRRIEDINRNLEAFETKNNPTSPTLA